MNPLLKNILVIDIETASSVQKYNELSSDMQEHWDRKSMFLRNEDNLESPELFEDRAAIYSEFGKIITIGFGAFYMEGENIGFKVKSLSGDDETKLLTAFKSLLEKYDQDNLKLCGHNGKEFDFPYLSRRFLVNHLAVPWSLNLSGKKPWEVHHIDTLELWKFGDRKSYTSLKLLTDLLGIPSSKTDMDGSMVSKTYYGQGAEGLKKIAKYCEADVVATAQLYLRLNNLPIMKEEHIIGS